DCRMLAARPFSQQARAAGKTCPATYNRRNEETETAMKVFMFHLMPYAYLDMSFSDKYSLRLGGVAEHLFRSEQGARALQPLSRRARARRRARLRRHLRQRASPECV